MPVAVDVGVDRRVADKDDLRPSGREASRGQCWIRANATMTCKHKEDSDRVGTSSGKEATVAQCQEGDGDGMCARCSTWRNTPLVHYSLQRMRVWHWPKVTACVHLRSLQRAVGILRRRKKSPEGPRAGSWWRSPLAAQTPPPRTACPEPHTRQWSI